MKRSSRTHFRLAGLLTTFALLAAPGARAQQADAVASGPPAQVASAGPAADAGRADQNSLLVDLPFQQLAEAFPQAVTSRPGFRPDVYAVAERAEAFGSVLRLTLPAPPPAGTKAGRRVRLIGPRGEVIAAVEQVAGPMVWVRDVTGASLAALANQAIFVFGFEHPAVPVVDANALARRHGSTTQELNQQMAELQRQNATLRQRVDQAEAALGVFEARLRALETGGAHAGR